ncbi:MAG: glycosyltransferase family 4 protein [Bacteroidota bacterium]|nr:glycosyltransferase family 4 protein [Bacteroidota bacterium]
MSKLRKHIIFVHLLNDYSGSPLILSQVLQLPQVAACDRTLYTSGRGKSGFLSNIAGVEYQYFWYQWASNPWLRLINYTISQILLFFKMLRYWRKDATIYVNTLLPFGAALAGKLMGKTVIYHVHETSMRPALLKKFLRAVARFTATKIIHVSKYLAATEAFPGVSNEVVYNTISPQFAEAAKQNPDAGEHPFRVLMLCSLKRYKGVDEFVSIARRMPGISFELVLNASESEIANWPSLLLPPLNLQVYPAQRNVHPFYQRASLLVNLSHPDEWIETFGMTVLEGMHYRLPAIVPPTGGIAELVDHGVNGYLADYRDLQTITSYISSLANDNALYAQMSTATVEKAAAFGHEPFAKSITQCLALHLSCEPEQTALAGRSTLKSISI